MCFLEDENNNCKPRRDWPVSELVCRANRRIIDTVAPLRSGRPPHSKKAPAAAAAASSAVKTPATVAHVGGVRSVFDRSPVRTDLVRLFPAGCRSRVVGRRRMRRRRPRASSAFYGRRRGRRKKRALGRTVCSASSAGIECTSSGRRRPERAQRRSDAEWLVAVTPRRKKIIPASPSRCSREGDDTVGR